MLKKIFYAKEIYFHKVVLYFSEKIQANYYVDIFWQNC